MKRNKIILLVCLGMVISCTEPELPTPEVIANSDIFKLEQSSILNGQSVYFDLSSAGIYMLTLVNKENGQVISREKFVGQIGQNTRKIYTNSLEPKIMYLVLEDSEKKEIKKTIIQKK